MIIRLRLLAGLTTAALVPLATIAGPAAATTGSACPDGDVPSAGFADAAGNAHARSIDCAVWWGITGGTSADTYAPSGTLTRAQLASMLARLVEKADRAPTSVESQGFTDTTGNAHARNIDMVAQLGVVGGYSDGTFRPGLPVTRAQVASMLVRLETNVFDGAFSVGDAKFDDIDGNVHRDAIVRLVGAGITQGVSATSFGPGVSVTRAQMATFVMRHVDRHVADGTLTTPERSEESPEPPTDGGNGTYAWPGSHGEVRAGEPALDRPDPLVQEIYEDGVDQNLCRPWVVRERGSYVTSRSPVDVFVDTEHQRRSGLSGCVVRRAETHVDGDPQLVIRAFPGSSFTPPSGAQPLVNDQPVSRAYTLQGTGRAEVAIREGNVAYVMLCNDAENKGTAECHTGPMSNTIDILVSEIHDRPTLLGIERAGA